MQAIGARTQALVHNKSLDYAERDSQAKSESWSHELEPIARVLNAGVVLFCYERSCDGQSLWPIQDQVQGTACALIKSLLRPNPRACDQPLAGN